jgi:hypothetical protein
LTDGVEVWLLSWAPGQGTAPHDHGGASGAFTVLLGELAEDYRRPRGPIRAAIRREGCSLGFGPERVHRLRNLSALCAASVHAYFPPLLPTREFPQFEG